MKMSRKFMRKNVGNINPNISVYMILVTKKVKRDKRIHIIIRHKTHIWQMRIL